MKKLLFVFVVLASLVSCKPDANKMGTVEYTFKVDSYTATMLKTYDSTGVIMDYFDLVPSNYEKKWMQDDEKEQFFYCEPMIPNQNKTFSITLLRGDELLVKVHGVNSAVIVGKY
jgi:hypothetical protein